MSNNLQTENSTNIRKEFSSFIDSVIRERPKVIKRNRDELLVSNISLFKDILEVYKFTADKFIEEDNSITLSLNEIDLVVNGATLDKAIINLTNDILEYAKDYYNEFNYWNSAANRRHHLPFVLKVLLTDNVEDIIRMIEVKE